MNILLCEDERALSSALCAILQHVGYTVDAAFDGEESLQKINSIDYDCVILDIMMPKRDGISVLKEVRSMGNNVPIIMLTAKFQIEDKIFGLENGANDYLPKPFDAKELIARINAITNNDSHNASMTLVVGDLELNRATFEIKTKNGTCLLSKKEFQMMELFMLHGSYGIPKETFLEKIWEKERDNKDVVWIYASYLKRKLESIDANVKIIKNDDEKYFLEVT